MAWEDGRLLRAVIRSKLGGECRVRAAVPLVIGQGEPTAVTHVDAQGTFSLVMSADEEHILVGAAQTPNT